jgi:hypothetical protein
MNWLKQLHSRGRRYQELSESIREHLDEKIADLMDRGLTREQAEHTARREFGNVTRIEERSREVWQWPRVENIWADVRFAFRQFGRNRGFAITVILTIALGIGLNTAHWCPAIFPEGRRKPLRDSMVRALRSGMI